MNIYVGNLAQDVSEEDLKRSFTHFGQLDTVSIIKDKFNGQSKGFGFVEMRSMAEGRAAIDALNGQSLKGKNLVVNEARARPDNQSRRGGRSGGRRF